LLRSDVIFRTKMDAKPINEIPSRMPKKSVRQGQSGKASATRETDLYAPVKQLLEDQGYEVKSEIEKADVVGYRNDEDPVIIELKTRFSLSLIHQAIERQSLTDAVYIAVPRQKGNGFLKSLHNNMALCRRLGLGLITVRLKDGFVETHLDPASYKPRQSKQKKGRLLREFARRVGDPNKGGVARTGIVTAYRQDALVCLNFLAENGPTKAALVTAGTRVEIARRIMSDDHYGWFERVSTGIYAITPAGRKALVAYARELKAIKARAEDATPRAKSA
jgi:hypothetical protein